MFHTHADQTLRTPTRTWDGSVRAFAPLEATVVDQAVAPSTMVQITNAGASDVLLVLTLVGTSSGAGPVQRVAALQTVSTNVRIDFGQQAALVWIASLQQQGSLSPNTAAYAFVSSTDSFQLWLGEGVTLSHDATGWSIPAYDSTQYTVNVGFGLQVNGWAYWALSVVCTPQQPVKVDVEGYELVRSNGALQVGDPISSSQGWDMPLGYRYDLAFDQSGTGTLTTISAAYGSSGPMCE